MRMRIQSILLLIMCLIACSSLAATGNNQKQKEKESAKTIIVSAEGLVDANAEIYKKDKGLMIDDLRKDARRQIIEKAVGVYVDSSTLVENYTVINDRVLSKSQGLIKEIIKESEPWLGKDGFMHILMKAEVYIGDVKSAIQDLSKERRISIIKEQGNPKIAVRIFVKDAERSSDNIKERSSVAENVLKEHIKGFGYTVWSDDTNSKDKQSDFLIEGEAKFQRLSHVLPASGVRIEKFVLTSWSVKCVNTHTGEEIYFNNKVPQKKSWNSEDAAVEEIGKMIGSEFSRDFFADHLQQPSRIYQLKLTGLPDYDTAELFKKEFIGLRNILNVDFRNFQANGPSLFEIEFAGLRGNFNTVVNEGILKPLNAKVGANAFRLTASHGDVIEIAYAGKGKQELLKAMEEMPPASLVQASPERLKEVAKSPETKKKVEAMTAQLSTTTPAMSSAGREAVKNF
jgi:hypothetical protein